MNLVEGLNVIDGALIADGWSTPRSVLNEELRAFMIARGVDEWDIDNVIPTVRYDRAHFSDIYGGFVHDCAGHLPEETDPAQCFPDSRPVVVVNNIPVEWTS